MSTRDEFPKTALALVLTFISANKNLYHNRETRATKESRDATNKLQSKLSRRQTLHDRESTLRTQHDYECLHTFLLKSIDFVGWLNVNQHCGM